MLIRSASAMVLALSVPIYAQPAAPRIAEPSDLAYPRELPPIGKWMIAQDGTIAHWLGELVDGRALREPINIIIIDGISGSAQESASRLEAAATAAGFPIRSGHSGGYRALIDRKVFPQLPKDRDRAFSNEIAELTNDHGRLFGPYPFGGAFLFIGAFSREDVRVAQVPHHSFASFNQGRDDFARNLDRKTEFKISDFVCLDNSIIGDRQTTTGDHDGIAVLLRASR